MKRMFITGMLGAVLLALPAQALPGWTAGYVRNWIRNHSFLSPNFDDSGAGVVWNIIGQRDVEGGEQLFVRYESGMFKVGDEWPAKAPAKNVFPKVSLGIIKKADYSGRAGVWARNSELSLMILDKVYGKSVALDFETSKMVFKGLDFYTEFSDDGVGRVPLEEVPTQTGELWDKGEVSFFQGQHYAYEIDAERATLTIMTRQQLPIEISIMQHNAKINQAYQQRESRKKPVKLGN